MSAVVYIDYSDKSLHPLRYKVNRESINDPWKRKFTQINMDYWTVLKGYLACCDWLKFLDHLRCCHRRGKDQCFDPGFDHTKTAYWLSLWCSWILLKFLLLLLLTSVDKPYFIQFRSFASFQILKHASRKWTIGTDCSLRLMILSKLTSWRIVVHGWFMAQFVFNSVDLFYLYIVPYWNMGLSCVNVTLCEQCHSCFVTNRLCT